jgi:hypothetical protein
MAAMEKEKIPISFVARIWLEGGSGGDPIWRGHVRHVQGDEDTYFQDLGKMNEFMARVSGLPGFRPTGRLAGSGSQT